MADQVMMLDKGKIQLDDSPENIKGIKVIL